VLAYLFGFAHGRRRVLESTGGRAIGRTRLSFWKEFFIAVSSVRGYIQYMALALPGVVIISEWWASETSIFLSGRLEPSPEIALGGTCKYIVGIVQDWLDRLIYSPCIFSPQV
jgi:hypothetical protein